MLKKDELEVDELADELTDWTRRWLSALPEKAGRALKNEELDALKCIFKQILETRKVDVTSIPIPETMRRSQLLG
jgi:hypothetical protein